METLHAVTKNCLSKFIILFRVELSTRFNPLCKTMNYFILENREIYIPDKTMWEQSDTYLFGYIYIYIYIYGN